MAPGVRGPVNLRGLAPPPLMHNIFPVMVERSFRPIALTVVLNSTYAMDAGEAIGEGFLGAACFQGRWVGISSCRHASLVGDAV